MGRRRWRPQRGGVAESVGCGHELGGANAQRRIAASFGSRGQPRVGGGVDERLPRPSRIQRHQTARAAAPPHQRDRCRRRCDGDERALRRRQVNDHEEELVGATGQGPDGLYFPSRPRTTPRGPGGGGAKTAATKPRPSAGAAVAATVRQNSTVTTAAIASRRAARRILAATSARRPPAPVATPSPRPRNHRRGRARARNNSGAWGSSRHGRAHAHIHTTHACTQAHQ